MITEAPYDILSTTIDADPRTCLMVGDCRFAAAALDAALPSFDHVFVYDGEECGDPPVGTAVSERLTGPLVALTDYPSLLDVVTFARTQADARSILRVFARSLETARTAGDAGTALSRLGERVRPIDLDLVVIGDEPILAGEVVRQTLGAGAFLISGTVTRFGGAAAFAALTASTDYALVSSDGSAARNWALFARQTPRLPIHFLTPALDDGPFIRLHHPIFAALPFDWHWHVIESAAQRTEEAVARAVAETPISGQQNRGGSGDGDTAAYIDELAATDPKRVTVYRPDDREHRVDALNRVATRLSMNGEQCLLWWVDSDELWTADRIVAVRDAFFAEPNRTAAYFRCRYYVGPDRGVATPHDPADETPRAWRFAPGMFWTGEQRLALMGRDEEGAYDVGGRHPFSRRETQAIGAEYDKFALATEPQAFLSGLQHGHEDAALQWRRLQEAPRRSVRLGDYLPWMPGRAMVDTLDRLGWIPPAAPDPASGRWRWRSDAEMTAQNQHDRAGAAPLIVVDGVFFQLSNSGIARVWTNLLAEWCRSGFGDHVVLLDRGGTAPRIDGVRYHPVELHSAATVDGDARYLQEVCDRLGATLFVSTYYTMPMRTPTVFMGYDMIPETLDFDPNDTWWRQKRRAIQHASAWIMISRSAASELALHHPFVAGGRLLVAPCAADPVFTPCSPEEVATFRERFALEREFVMLVGERIGPGGYKNGIVVFAALALLPKESRPLLICVGGAADLEGVGKALLDEGDVRLLRLDDQDLRRCYAASLAYICPSLMEGFGLPILEAMKVGAPALVCRNSAIPEVAGDAGVYFDPLDPLSLIDAIARVSDADERRTIVAAGRQQAERFDQVRTARAIADHLIEWAGTIANQGPDRAILADVLRDAEAHRRESATIAAIDQRVALIDRALTAADRALDTGLDNVDAMISSRMAEARKAIADACGDLRDLKIPVERWRDDAAPDIWGGDGVTSVESVGLSRIEGPYPDFGMLTAFRWQIAPISVTTFVLDGARDVWLEIDLGNVKDRQALLFGIGGRTICALRPPQTGWDHVWRVRLPLSLPAGLTQVSIDASDHDLSVADGRSLYIAVYGIRLVGRDARPEDAMSVADIGVHRADAPRWAYPALEVPARPIASTGLAPFEGPFPDWGIERPFQWQTAPTSHHRFVLEEACQADLQITFSNVEPDQTIDVWHERARLHSFSPAALGWSHQWQVTLPVELERGAVEFRVQATRHHQEAGDGRSLFIGIYDCRLLLRRSGSDRNNRIVDVAAA